MMKKGQTLVGRCVFDLASSIQTKKTWEDSSQLFFPAILSNQASTFKRKQQSKQAKLSGQ
jgi:hypothetical protein